MDLWETKTDCCGCTACEIVCPKHCISMVYDKEGFLYPHVDKIACIECGLCQKVCPIKSTPHKRNIARAWVAQHKDKDILYSSSSGGIFSGIANHLLSQGYTIVGVVYDNSFRVVHILSQNEYEIHRMRGSKYIQSDMRGVMIVVRRKLEAGHKICFIGTPCQVAGLKNYLSNDYADLICIDLVCHGVASPLIWKRYIKELETKFDAKIVEYSFRSKHKGHHNFGTYAKFENGAEYFRDDNSSEKDFMHLAYFNEVCSRPSCHACRFKSKERCSDLTMFDCWHVEDFTDLKDDDKGFSTVFVYSNKGETLFKSITKEYIVRDVTNRINDIIEKDGGNVIYSMVPNNRRDQFMKDLQNGMQISELQKKYLTQTIGGKIKFQIKKMIVWLFKTIGIFTKLRSVYYSRYEKKYTKIVQK